MISEETWSEWRLLMIESDFLNALKVGYMPHEFHNSNNTSSQLVFCKANSVFERADELRNFELETGRVVSIVWREAYFDRLTRSFPALESESWKLNLVMPLSSRDFKLGLESEDRSHTLEAFFSSAQMFNEMVPNREVDELLLAKNNGKVYLPLLNTSTTIGEAY